MFLISWPGGSWEATLRYGTIFTVIFLSAFWIATVFWTYRDIRQRTRDPILQTAAVILVLIFNFPGHWIYLIVRPRQTLTELYERSLEEEALLQELEDQKACPTCKRRVKDEFLVCPSCRTQLKEACRQCSKPLSYAWVACPYCGLEKPPREGFGPRPVRAPGAPAAQGRSLQPKAPQAIAPRPAAAQEQRAQPARPLPQSIQAATTVVPTPRSDPFGGRRASGAGAESGDGPVIGE
jgi:RNA polymerase subunit RPABC4/transcription elongation factor Spt4